MGDKVKKSHKKLLLLKLNKTIVDVHQAVLIRTETKKKGTNSFPPIHNVVMAEPLQTSAKEQRHPTHVVPHTNRKKNAVAIWVS